MVIFKGLSLTIRTITRPLTGHPKNEGTKTPQQIL